MPNAALLLLSRSLGLESAMLSLSLSPSLTLSLSYTYRPRSHAHEDDTDRGHLKLRPPLRQANGLAGLVEPVHDAAGVSLREMAKERKEMWLI